MDCLVVANQPACSNVLLIEDGRVVRLYQQAREVCAAFAIGFAAASPATLKVREANFAKGDLLALHTGEEILAASVPLSTV
jgi:hypothetical protein